jgi:hypothetical protein
MMHGEVLRKQQLSKHTMDAHFYLYNSRRNLFQLEKQSSNLPHAYKQE